MLITPLNIKQITRQSLIGASVTDPVVPERTSRWLPGESRPHQYREPAVHLHAHADKHPEVCHDVHCSRPRLQLA